MTWFLTAFLCVLLVEIFIRLPLLSVVSRIDVVGRKALRTLGAKSVSDHWKEKALFAYAVSLFALSMRLAGYLVVVGGVAVSFILIFDYLGIMVGEFVTGWLGGIFSLVVATLYYLLRKFHA